MLIRRPSPSRRLEVASDPPLQVLCKIVHVDTDTGELFVYRAGRQWGVYWRRRSIRRTRRWGGRRRRRRKEGRQRRRTRQHSLVEIGEVVAEAAGFVRVVKIAAGVAGAHVLCVAARGVDVAPRFGAPTLIQVRHDQIENRRCAVAHRGRLEIVHRAVMQAIT